jgi:CBS domain containing-hemolysin-like protein
MWLACLGFLGIRALLAAAEAALYGTSDLRAKQLSLSHPGAGHRVLRLKTDRELTAGALRIGMILAGFLAAGIGAIAPPRMLDLTRFGDAPWLSFFTPLAGAFLAALLASVFDTIGRSVANTDPPLWALRLSFILSVTSLLIRPLMRLLLTLLDVLARPFGGRVRFEAPPPPLEELEKLLTAQAAKDEVDKSAPQLIRSIFALSDKRCRDVMVPRTEVIAIDLTTPPADILMTLAEENHSRMPVYRDDPDHIVGILHVRDLIPLMQHPELIVLADIIRPAHFVPWVKPIGDLLRDMQKRKIHLATVVDEYGGFMGIVTLEDILREIVGDIGDEFEVEKKHVEKQADGSYLVDAALEVGDFAKTFPLALPDGDYDTLGGFLSSLAGSIPEVGERFSFSGWQFTVQSKEGARLGRIRVVKPKAAAPSQPPTPVAARKEAGASGTQKEKEPVPQT